MKKEKKYINKATFLGSTFASLLITKVALGWGSYGHQQINSAALKLVQESPIARCLKSNSDLIIRLAVTPDVDWKSSELNKGMLNALNSLDTLKSNPSDSHSLKILQNLEYQERNNNNPYIS